MKIVYVYDLVYPYVVGGVQKRIWELSKRLAERGNDVHIFGMKHWNGEDILTRESVFLHGVCKPCELYVNGKRSINEAIHFAYKILPSLLKEDPDIIDCSQFPYFPCFSAYLHSKIKRSSLVITWHEVWGSYWSEYLGKKGVFGKFIERTITRLTDKVIAVSDRVKRSLELIKQVEKIEVIPNGVDFRTIQKINPSDQESDVIFVGRLIKNKNVDLLIKSMNLVREKVPDVKCIIIGEGPERNTLEKLVNTLDLRNQVNFLGFLENHSDVIGLMKSSKVFVLPSTREGFGIVTLEANACGLPVITVKHKNNAASDLINDDENGFICNFSVEEIAEKILEGMNRKDMRNRCLEHSEEYDWDKITNMIKEFYLSLLTS